MAADEKGKEREIEGKTTEGVVAGTSSLNKYAFACAILASMNSILLGYDIGVMSGAVLYIKDDLDITSIQEEILVGSLNLFSLLGALMSGKTADWIGRRYTMMIAASTFLMGALGMGLASSFTLLMVGRAIAGLGVGYSMMTAPVYTAEVSPASTRGFLTSLPEVFITVGILLGYILNYAFSSLPEHFNWRLMLGVAAIPAGLLIIGLSIMPESPRWLVVKGRFNEAKQVLKKICENDEEAEVRLQEIATTIQEAMHLHEGKSVWKELLLKPSKATKKILMVAIGLNIFMQASGNDVVVYYTPEVFKGAGIKKKQHLVAVTIVMGFVKTSFVIVSALFLDKVGRRPMLLLGSCGMTLSLTTLGVCSKLVEKAAGKLMKAVVGISVLAICADVSFFSLGMGPITWVYSSEIFPMRLRAQGSSLAIATNRVVSGVISMSFLSLVKALSMGGTFFLFASIAALGALFFYSCLPETKGKTLEELEFMFQEDRKGKNVALSETSSQQSESKEFDHDARVIT